MGHTEEIQPHTDQSAPKPVISIKGKTETELANHMASFFAARAKLVTDQEASKYINQVPIPDVENDIEIDINIEKTYDVEELFKGKKRPSLAAGPDTISHRHISDLMPVLKPVLQKAVDKPLEKFPDITRNYIRPVSYTHLRAHETPEHRVCRRLR